MIGKNMPAEKRYGDFRLSAAGMAVVLVFALMFLPILLGGCAPAGDSVSGASGSSSSSDSAASSASAESQDSSASSASSESRVADTVTLNIEFPDDGGSVWNSVPFEEGITALDALQESSGDIVVEDSQYGPFVTSIQGVSNEGSSGWTYTVNGESPTVSAGDYKLSAGDSVEWIYYKA